MSKDLGSAVQPASWVRVLTAALCLAAALPLGLPGATAQERSLDGRVAFSAAAVDRETVTVDGFAASNLDGSGVRRLTSAPEEGTVDRTPQWSPDARWLAFTRAASEVARPFVVAASGGDPVALADEGRDPSWSDDGELLVWASDVPSPGIVVAQVSWTDAHVVVGEQRRIDLPAPADSPRLSPDGATVAFRMLRTADSTAADLWLATVDGSDRRRLTTDVDVAAGPPGSHSWSPDGTQIAFLAADAASRGNPRAHIVNADGSGRRLLFPSSGCEFSRGVAWAPHGEFLAVLQSCQGSGFHMVTPSGEWLGSVGAGVRRYGGFEFSADGADLYAAVLPPGASTDPFSGELRRIRLDGSGYVTLLTSPTVALEPIDVVTLSDVVPQVVMPPPPPPDEPPPDEDPRTARPQLRYACPVEEVPYADFLDVDVDSPHRLAIDCMAWWELVTGVARYRFGPADRVTRGQMASLLARVVTAGGGTLPSDSGDSFDDDDGSPHERNIDRLAAAGLVKGTGPRRFAPGAPVRRDQMASLVMAVYAYVSTVSPDPASRDYFSDDSHSVHQDAINRAVEAGFVTGVDEQRYAPDLPEQRDQAAARSARILDALVQQGQATPPRQGLARVTRIIDGDTVLANDPTDGTIRVRLLGINAKESGTCGARPARRALRDLVLDKTVRLSSDHPSSLGQRDRPLRFVEVYTDNGWIDVNAELLRQGHAVWFPKAKEPRNNNTYQLAAREAMASRRNLWAPAKCGRGPSAGAQLRMWVEADPPGPDADHLNGEWVRIHNTGEVDVQLTGWQLRDASARPPYRFAGDSMLRRGETMIVRLGSGDDGPLVRYWGRERPLFQKARRIRGQWMGDGAYLLDYDGDIRGHFMYPCVGPCTDPLIGQVAITRVVYDPPGDEYFRPNDESIRLRNVSEQAVSLYGYKLRAGIHTYAFPPDTVIAPGQTLTVRSGWGMDTDTRKYWGHETAILDDVTGKVILRTYDLITIACSAWGEELCE